jgi:hypothetical protein
MDSQSLGAYWCESGEVFAKAIVPANGVFKLSKGDTVTVVASQGSGAARIIYGALTNLTVNEVGV